MELPVVILVYSLSFMLVCLGMAMLAIAFESIIFDWKYRSRRYAI